jgi:hypothetical protein
MAERRLYIAETTIAPGTACVQGSAENKVCSPPAGGGNFIGVYAYEANMAKDAGDARGVVIYGVAKVLTGGEVSAGSFADIKDGNCAFVNAGGAGRVCGMFLQNGAAGEYVEMLVAPAPEGGSGSGGGGADPNAVHKTGDETIDGVKTFSQSPGVPSKGTLPNPASSTEYATEEQVRGRIIKPGNNDGMTHAPTGADTSYMLVRYLRQNPNPDETEWRPVGNFMKANPPGSNTPTDWLTYIWSLLTNTDTGGYSGTASFQNNHDLLNSPVNEDGSPFFTVGSAKYVSLL